MVSWHGLESGSEFPPFAGDDLKTRCITSVVSQNKVPSWQDGPIISDQIFSGSQSSLSFFHCFAGSPGGGLAESEIVYQINACRKPLSDL